MKAKLFTDGAARGNPGPAGAGAVLLGQDEEVLFEECRYLGEATNNVAEYNALIDGLKKALEEGIMDLNVYMDSELIVKQINGQYRVKNEGLKPLYKEAKDLLSKFSDVTVGHVRRENNKLADKLANRAIDEAL